MFDSLQGLLGHASFLLSGLIVTIELAVSCSIAALILGTLLGLARAYGGRMANAVIGVYVDVMRSIPQLVVLIYVYFALPILVQQRIDSFTAAFVGIVVWVTAIVTEAVRAGVLSVRTTQMRAGLALGMSRRQAIRRVVLPQALIRMLPVLGSTLIILTKDTVLASAIATPELLRQSQIVATQTYDPFTVLTVAMIIYFLLILPIARGTDWLYRRLSERAAG